MTDIRTTAEVEQIVGAEDLARLRRGETGGHYTCWSCRQPGASTEPTSVIAEIYAAVTRVTLAHARCAPSQVVHIDAAMPPGLADPTIGLNIIVQAAVIPATNALGIPTGMRPLLMAETVSEYSTRSVTGDRVDLLIGGFIEQGLTLMRGSSHQPKPAPGWRIALPSTERVVVYGPGDDVFCDALIEQPQPWRDLVNDAGTCVLLAGAIGLPGFGPSTTLPTVLQAIDRAARGGLLAGGLLPVTRS